MILLDTNIISEAMKPSGDHKVVDWINQQAPESLFICAPVLAELRYGFEQMPQGRRKSTFERACHLIETTQFLDRILPFDLPAAHLCANARARRAALGRPIHQIDAMIASIAMARSFVLATRNVCDFTGLGLELVNPFELA
ncbi:type II toxin-antitoxin system VapC family toxin [Terrarubrum flagellatum]|uniref:type II toxin-antitoxin system VapC family toxin n=1 Tax=Terrirubrum flagellatum TaxID=2895980 RepID=UPI00314513F6